MELLHYKVLVLALDPALKPVLGPFFVAERFEADWVRTVEKGAENLIKNHYDLVIGDLNLGHDKEGGLDLLKRLRVRDQNLPFVVIADQESLARSVEAINLGVAGFLKKPLNLAEIEETLRRAIRYHKSRFQKNQLVNYQMTNLYQAVIKSSEASSLKLLDTVDNLIELIYPEEYDSFPDLKMAIYEGLANAVEHGNLKNVNKNIFFQIHLKMDRILVQIKDEGAGFDAQKVTDTGEEAKHRGLGLIKHLMDEVSFNHKGNEINLLKLLASGPKG